MIQRTTRPSRSKLTGRDGGVSRETADLSRFSCLPAAGNRDARAIKLTRESKNRAKKTIAAAIPLKGVAFILFRVVRFALLAEVGHVRYQAVTATCPAGL